MFEFLVAEIPCAFAAACGRLEALEGAGLVLPTPLGQGRGIQAFSSQEGSEFSGLRTTLCLFDHAGLVRRGEPSSLGPGQDLRVGGGGIGGPGGWPPLPVPRPPLAAPPSPLL